MSTAHPSPLFIVGSPRSGTSALVVALRQAGYHGFNEGNLLGLMDEISRVVDQHFRFFWTSDPDVLISRLDREAFKATLFAPFRQVLERENPIAPWLDKSGNPALIRMIPALLALWPSAHFIFARRRGIENLVSRMRKFPGNGFEFHCKDWAANMSAWRDIRAAVPDLKCIEVEQHDMIENPDTVAAQLAGFLDLSAGQLTALLTSLRDERPEQTGDDTAARVLSLSATGWSARQVDIFLRHCKPEMDRYGYSLDETYRVQASSLPSVFTLATSFTAKL